MKKLLLVFPLLLASQVTASQVTASEIAPLPCVAVGNMSTTLMEFRQEGMSREMITQIFDEIEAKDKDDTSSYGLYRIIVEDAYKHKVEVSEYDKKLVIMSFRDRHIGLCKSVNANRARLHSHD